MEKAVQCNSLIGAIMGHDFTHIYDTDIRMISPRDYDHMCAVVQATSWGITREEILKKIPVKNTVKLYKMSICKRCGYTIKTEEKV